MPINLGGYLSIYLSMALHPLLDLGRFFSFLILYTVGRTPWTGDQPIARPLPTHTTTQTRNKRRQTSSPWVRFEPTIPAFQRAKTVHALDRAATVIGILSGCKGFTPRVPAHQLLQDKHQDMRQKLMSASWLRPVCGGFHNLIPFNCCVMSQTSCLDCYMFWCMPVCGLP
jgi:hypothetical protein